MSWDDSGDADDEPILPPLPQEDRIWRHPSEIAPSAPVVAAPTRRGSSMWAVAGAAGLIGAVFSLGVATLLGGLEPRVVERQLVERVAIPPIVGAGDSTADDGIVAVAELTSPAIARLEVTRSNSVSSGSGVVFRATDTGGYLLTNAHVVVDARSVQVELADGRLFDAEVVGSDPYTDIAVVRIEGRDLATAVLGPDVELRVGEPAIAIGSPAGLRGGPSVTTGVVSALGRRVDGPDSSLHDMIQFDAPITPGSSGGALVNASGAVVGITTAIAVTDFGAEGLGFATPIALARDVADDIIEVGVARHPFLGVEGGDLDMATVAERGYESGGAEVIDVLAGGPAESAGLRPGDVVVAVNGEPTSTMSRLVVVVRTYEPGDVVTVTYWRDGAEREAEVELGERPRS